MMPDLGFILLTHKLPYRIWTEGPRINPHWIVEYAHEDKPDQWAELRHAHRYTLEEAVELIKQMQYNLSLNKTLANYEIRMRHEKIGEIIYGAILCES